MRVLVTGARGFVGRHLCPLLTEHGFDVAAAVRARNGTGDLREVIVGDLADAQRWADVFVGVDAVVHLAARVHMMEDDADDALAAHRRVNTHATRRLAEAAAAAGVKRFVFLSTIKVLGERTDSRPFTHDDRPAPLDPYAISKLEAEQALAGIAATSAMEVVVLRPTLVYGPHVGGNVLRSLRVVRSGIPLPLGSIHNKRSMLAVSNLCDVIRVVLTHPNAAGRTFSVADGCDLSTGEFFEQIGRAMQKSVRLIPVPQKLLRFAGRLLGRSTAVARITESLQVDISETVSALDWRPPVSVAEEMDRMVAWFIAGTPDG